MYIQETKRTKKYRESTKNHQKITESTNKEPTKTTQKQEYLKKTEPTSAKKYQKELCLLIRIMMVLTRRTMRMMRRESATVGIDK